jgi:hypothetical protein
MTIDSYWDLEHHDDEAFTAASLKDLSALGGILGIEVRQLLLGPEAAKVSGTVVCRDISARLAERIARDGTTAEQLGDGIGWDVKPLLRDPRTLWGYNVQALYDLSKALGLDWVAALPTLSVSE